MSRTALLKQKIQFLVSAFNLFQSAVLSALVSILLGLLAEEGSPTSWSGCKAYLKLIFLALQQNFFKVCYLSKHSPGWRPGFLLHVLPKNTISLLTLQTVGNPCRMRHIVVFCTKVIFNVYKVIKQLSIQHTCWNGSHAAVFWRQFRPTKPRDKKYLCIRMVLLSLEGKPNSQFADHNNSKQMVCNFSYTK